MAKARPISSQQNVQAHRERDRSRAFKTEARRQSAAVAASASEEDDQSFVEALSDLTE